MGGEGSEAAISIFTAQQFVDKFNSEYETKHLKFEEQFWGTKMNLSGSEELVFSAENLSKTKKEMEDLLSDYGAVEKAEQLKAGLPADVAPKDLTDCLDIIIRTCKCYATSPDIKGIREETCSMESELEMSRNRMKLGYTLDGEFKKASSVELRNMMQTCADEKTRKAAYKGLRSIGPFICKNGKKFLMQIKYVVES